MEGGVGDGLGGQLEAVWVAVNETQLGIVLGLGKPWPGPDVDGALGHEVVQAAICHVLERLGAVLRELPRAAPPGDTAHPNGAVDRRASG